MNYFMSRLCIRTPLLTAALAAALAPAYADITFDFESPTQLQSGRVDGDLINFAMTPERGHNGSSNSLKFIDLGPEPYENFTYDIPFDPFTSGVISINVYDKRGNYNTGHGQAQSGGSIILENKNNPQDFVAFEVLSYPYGRGNIPSYYGTEGIVDRLKANDRFDTTGLPNRSVGHHKVEFHISATDSRLFVDGLPALEVAGPGSGSPLRLRFMADSPSNGGSQSATEIINWISAPRDFSANAGEWLYFDDLRIARELPSVSVHTNGFEIISGTPEYDRAGEPGQPGTSTGHPPHDNIYMSNFVNQWNVTTSATAVKTGNQAFWFSNATPGLRSLTFDLAGLQPNTTATLYFYDALGQDVLQDRANSIIIENADDPADFIAVQVMNWRYPYFNAIKNYYLTEGSDPAGSFWSECFPGRTIGWHKVEIGFYPTHTQMVLDGKIGHRNNPANIAQGPGLDKPLRLRLMADDATQGGYGNWTQVNELTARYHANTEPYVYYDDITLPVPPAASVSEWQLY